MVLKRLCVGDSEEDGLLRASINDMVEDSAHSLFSIPRGQSLESIKFLTQKMVLKMSLGT